MAIPMRLHARLELASAKSGRRLVPGRMLYPEFLLIGYRRRMPSDAGRRARTAAPSDSAPASLLDLTTPFAHGR